jgi:hypothetical protein
VVGINVGHVGVLVVVVDVAGGLRPLEQGQRRGALVAAGVALAVAAGLVDLADAELAVGDFPRPSNDRRRLENIL